jgi:hypothetical protein
VSNRDRIVVFSLLAASMALLIPGLFAPVLSIRGYLTRDGVSKVAPQLLEKGLDDETVASLKSLMNPQMVALLQFTGGDLRKTLIEKLSPQLSKALQNSVAELEVYTQTRSIVSSVQNLYEVGSPVPATLILLFSVVVPFGKAGIVAWAMFADDARRRRALSFVESIAKWSMADVFVVALFIAYLAAKATQSSGDPAAPPLVAFDARFGSGFYWFAAYCVFSLASQQYTARLARRERVV